MHVDGIILDGGLSTSMELRIDLKVQTNVAVRNAIPGTS